MDQESFQVMQLFYTSLISRGIFTIGIFFMAWVAMRVGRTVGENPNIVAQLFSTAFGLVVCWFGLVQQSFTTWTLETTAYQLSQLENIPAEAESFISFFGTEGVPVASVVPDPLTAIFWLCILAFILIPTWQTKWLERIKKG